MGINISISFIVIFIGAIAYLYVKNINKRKSGETQNLDIQTEQEDEGGYPYIEADLDSVRIAIRTFAEGLPKGVFRTILAEDDNRIDFKQIAHILGGIPTKNYYLSKETYDIFEESDKHIPTEMDMVQKAVDQYVKDFKEFPILPFDPHKRINYYQLQQNRYLKTPPATQFYLTNLDGLITHKKPAKKNLD